jgi:hypothetical protein
VELWSIIGNLSPGVAVGVLCLYLYNTMALRYLEERKEMLQNMMVERKEWNESLRLLNTEYRDLQRLVIEAMTSTRGEMHALRNKLTEFMVSIENQLRGLDARLHGSSND